jgi:hypothetical protein
MPSTPTITVTDNEDGTAAVVVSGSDVGTTNTVYYAPVNYDLNDGSTWTSGGSRSGDGSVSVTPVYVRNRGGVYLWRAESSDGAIAHSNIIQSRVSGSSQSVKERIMEAVHSQISSAGLAGLKSNDVVLQTVPDQVTRRMIIVASIDPESELTGARQGSNVRDDIVYPITIAHVDVGNRAQTAEVRNRTNRWRQDIRRLFSRQQLTGVSEVRDCTVSYRTSADTTAWFKNNLLLGSMALVFTTREVRTL